MNVRPVFVPNDDLDLRQRRGLADFAFNRRGLQFPSSVCKRFAERFRPGAFQRSEAQLQLGQNRDGQVDGVGVEPKAFDTAQGSVDTT
jgi:hypothetical protein